MLQAMFWARVALRKSPCDTTDATWLPCLHPACVYEVTEWPAHVTASLVLGLSSHDPWYQQGFVESGPCKTILKCWCAQTGVTSCLRLFISFPSAGPAAIPGCGLASLLVRRASLRGQVGFLLPGSPSALPASHLTLSFLTPWAYPSVLKRVQSWENHPPTLVGEGYPCAWFRSDRSGAQRVLHSSRVILGL